jgi:hypothetical protein
MRGLRTGASAEQERAGAGGATIKMKLGERGPVFVGANAVDKGEKLKIVNRTPVEKVGPHTFTLVKPSLVDSRRDQRRCERFESKVCQNVLDAHRVGPPPDFEVGTPDLEVGKTGWDKEFTNTAKGDSWYTEELGDSDTRRVTAKAGERLGYFCLVHPFMQGSLKVK